MVITGFVNVHRARCQTVSTQWSYWLLSWSHLRSLVSWILNTSLFKFPFIISCIIFDTYCIKLTLIIHNKFISAIGSFADEPEKLVNGTPTSIQRYSHCISIRTSNSHMCGGSIISSRFILTAGHCVAPLLSDASLRSRAVVVSGTTYLNSGGQSHKITKLHLHPSYKDTSGRPAGYDIGIIEVRLLDIHRAYIPITCISPSFYYFCFDHKIL